MFRSLGRGGRNRLGIGLMAQTRKPVTAAKDLGKKLSRGISWAGSGLRSAVPARATVAAMQARLQAAPAWMGYSIFKPFPKFGAALRSKASLIIVSPARKVTAAVRRPGLATSKPGGSIPACAPAPRLHLVAPSGKVLDDDMDEAELSRYNTDCTVRAARLRENARCAAIMLHPAAKGREAVAANLAFKTNTPRHEAIRILQTVPVAAAQMAPPWERRLPRAASYLFPHDAPPR